MNISKCLLLLFLAASQEAVKSSLSDMDYLRSKVVQTKDVEESNEHSEGDEEEEEDAPVQHADSAYESSENVSLAKVSSVEKKLSKVKKSTKQEVTTETNLQVKH